MLGLRDYVEKNRFKGVVLGLSGGIDSAVCAAMAVDALGAERVRCIMLPYRYTSAESLTDAAECAKRLGVQYDVLPIAPAVEGFGEVLDPLFANLPRDVTEENIQSRVRGVALMAVSNKLGLMLVTTGNKSEVSVGYATIYGDMNGGFNPIKDLYKTEVYRLARFRNRERPPGCLGPEGEVIPLSIIEQGADGGASREPEGPGFAAALRGARRHPRSAWWRRRCGSTTSSRSATTARP